MLHSPSLAKSLKSSAKCRWSILSGSVARRGRRRVSLIGASADRGCTGMSRKGGGCYADTASGPGPKNYLKHALWTPNERLALMMRLSLFLLVLILQAKPPAKPAGAWPPPVLDEKSYKKWSEFIRPSADELKWKKIPWRTDLVAAVAEGKALNRPILLWSDQGNPLGLVDMAPSINTCVARQQVWSDDEVQKLAAAFVPVTAEVWTLATGQSP